MAPSLSSATLSTGCAYAALRASFALIAPLRALGLLQVTGVHGKPIAATPSSGFQTAALLLGGTWGIVMSMVLVVALIAARRGHRAGWWALFAWWGVAGTELLTRCFVGVFASGSSHPIHGFFLGSSAGDDLCCCLPVGVAWLAALGVALVRRASSNRLGASGFDASNPGFRRDVDRGAGGG